MVTPFDVVLALVIVLGLPLRALFGYRRLARAADAELPALRPRLYRRAIVSQWLLVAALLSLWFATGRSWTDLGLWPRPTMALFGIGAGVLLVLPALFRQRAQLAGDRELQARVRERLSGVQRLIPRTEAEHRRFNVLAVTAGICEELLYRGYLAWFAHQWLPVLPAHAAVAIAFGVGHAYQGPRGMLRTGLAGAFFSALTLVAGSLLPAMALHAAMDLFAGDMGRRLLDADNASVPGATAT